MEKGGTMIPDKLKELEARVRGVLDLLAQTRQERSALQAMVGELQGEISMLKEGLKKEQSRREQMEGELKRLEVEREEVRSKVEELLAELAKIEALQGG